jgi:hypothetical protein
MLESTAQLSTILDSLSKRARAAGFSDTEWANRAGVRKETLSRLRRRQTCDFQTLHALAHAVDARLGVVEAPPPDRTTDGHFPAKLDREYEERLIDLCQSGDFGSDRWLAMGPRFFMAGLAVMLASAGNRHRRVLLELAERLHPGSSDVDVFNRWLERSPLKPSRFLPLVDSRRARAA